jgi:hypothetical protein
MRTASSAIQTRVHSGDMYGRPPVGKSFLVVSASGSPLLANIYLHYLFDLWLQAWPKKHVRGDVIVCGHI